MASLPPSSPDRPPGPPAPEASCARRPRGGRAGRLPAAVLVLLVLAVLVLLPVSIAGRAGDADWTGPLLDAARLLERRHVARPTPEELRDAALAGLAFATGDPYTEYVPPSGLAAFEKSLQGTYGGIGAEIRRGTDGRLVVVTPLDDAPALDAGLLAGDEIVAIDGASTDGLGMDEVVARLGGDPGTTVVVSFVRGEAPPRDTVIRRAIITTRTVNGLVRTGPDGRDWCTELDGDLGLHYLRIEQFNPATAGELADFLGRIDAAGGRGLVLDLRGNPGGGLEVAVDVADLFLDARTVVFVRGPGIDEVVERTTDRTPARDLELVVLVDEGSASASEILAGALQAAGRARVAGTRTFGKGSVQEVRPLAYGAGLLKLTVARYELEGGRVIQRSEDASSWGVDPDPGLAAATSGERRLGVLARREEAEAIGPPPPTPVPCGDREALLARLDDPVLDAAAAALAARVADGAWPRTADDDDPDARARRREIDAVLETRAEFLRRVAELDDRLAELQAPPTEATGDATGKAAEGGDGGDGSRDP